MTKYMSPGALDLPVEARRKLRGIGDCVRLFPFDLNSTWVPPGLPVCPAPLVKEQIGGKMAADALEAIIGVVFEASGAAGARAFLKRLHLVHHLDVCSPLISVI